MSYFQRLGDPLDSINTSYSGGGGEDQVQAKNDVPMTNESVTDKDVELNVV